MDSWMVLGLEPTKDESEIKRAYLKKLPLYHPEEDQAGFRRLREAYEAALRSLKEVLPEEDDSPSGLIVAECKALYQDFFQRINPEAWQRILDREICQRIDMQQEIGEKLLAFLLKAYRLPHVVWKLLTDFFCWETYQELLKEKFPPQFIQYVFNQSTYPDIIRYEYFSPQEGLDYDRFIQTFMALYEAVSSGKEEEAEALLLEMDSLGIDHPDYTLLKMRYYLLSKRQDLAVPLAEPLLEEYPEDIPILHGVAQCRLWNKGPEKAQPLFAKILERNPEHHNAKVGLANCLYQQKDYAAAKEAYRDLLLAYPYDVYVGNAFYDTNEKLLEIYEEQLSADPANQDIIYKLASCYHNCRRFSDAQNLLVEVEPEPAFAAKHHSIYAYALMVAGDKEGAIRHYYLWESLEEDRLRVVRELPLELFALGQEEEALARCDLYLQDYPQEAVLYDVKAGVLCKRRQLKEALGVMEEGLAVKGDYLNLHAHKAELLYELKDYAGALDSAAAALEIYPFVYDMLLLQLKIYNQTGNYREVLAVCARIDQYNIQEAETELYRGLANMGLDLDIPHALTLLEQYLEIDPTNDLAVYALKEYYERRNEFDQALTYLNKAIENSPQQQYFRLNRARIYRWQKKTGSAMADIIWIEQNQPLETADFYNEKGLLYEALNDKETARVCFEKVIAINEYDGSAYGNLASICAQLQEYEKAVEYYTKQIAIREHPHYYISRGLAYSHLGKSEEERADYLKTIELDPNHVYAHNNMGILCYEENHFSEAAAYLTKALELDPSILSAQQYRMKALLAMGEMDKALASLDAALVYFKNAEKSVIQLLNEQKLKLLTDCRRYEAALAMQDAALQIKHDYVYRMLGYCAYELRRDGVAGQLFDKALRSYQPVADTYRAVGYFYWHGLKKIHKAIVYCEKAVAMDGNNYKNRLLLAQVHEYNRNEKAAAQHFAVALDLVQGAWPSDPKPCDYYYVGACYSGLKNQDKAEFYFLQALELSKHYPHCTARCCSKSLFGLAGLWEKAGDFERARGFYEEAALIRPDRRNVDSREAFLAKYFAPPKKKRWFDFFRKRK